MLLETIRAALGMIAILRILQSGPRSPQALKELLSAGGILLEDKVLKGLLRRLVREGFVTQALHVEPGKGGERRYWTTRRGTLASDSLQGPVGVLGGGAPGSLRS
jgi:DNA-binding HxlR family transcriptional regulator